MNAEAASSEARPAPLVICIPPSKRRPLETLETAGAVLLTLGCAVLGSLLLIDGFLHGRLHTLVFGGVSFAIGITLARWIIVANRRHRTIRAAILESMPTEPPHPMAEQLAAAWWHPLSQPPRDALWVPQILATSFPEIIATSGR